MRKITKEEFELLSLCGTNEDLKDINSLSVYEGLEIDLDEWKSSHHPAFYLHGYKFKKSGKKFKIRTDKNGKKYYILRTK